MCFWWCGGIRKSEFGLFLVLELQKLYNRNATRSPENISASSVASTWPKASAQIRVTIVGLWTTPFPRHNVNVTVNVFYNVLHLCIQMQEIVWHLIRYFLHNTESGVMSRSDKDAPLPPSFLLENKEGHIFACFSLETFHINLSRTFSRLPFCEGHWKSTSSH